ncbi:hypothetical protein [Azospirillum endophyticum]
MPGSVGNRATRHGERPAHGRGDGRQAGQLYTGQRSTPGEANQTQARRLATQSLRRKHSLAYVTRPATARQRASAIAPPRREAPKRLRMRVGPD